jgi:hypothetical protein
VVSPGTVYFTDGCWNITERKQPEVYRDALAQLVGAHGDPSGDRELGRVTSEAGMVFHNEIERRRRRWVLGARQFKRSR